MYSKQVMDHFQNPRNVGELENPDTVGEVGNPSCGDIIQLFLKINDEVIKDIKFKTFGCGAAVATSSLLTELIKGKKIKEALKISNKNIAEKLGGLPKNKMHCSNLATNALQDAIEKYRKDN